MPHVTFRGGSKDGQIVMMYQLRDIYRVPVYPKPESRHGVAPGRVRIEDYRLIDGVYVLQSS